MADNAIATHRIGIAWRCITIATHHNDVVMPDNNIVTRRIGVVSSRIGKVTPVCGVAAGRNRLPLALCGLRFEIELNARLPHHWRPEVYSSPK